MSSSAKPPEIIEPLSLPNEYVSNFLKHTEEMKGIIETKDAATLEEAEHRALVNRILKTMRLTFERLQVALVAPHILHRDENILKRLVGSYDRDVLSDICAKYLAIENLDRNSDSDHLLVDYDLIQAIDLLHSNNEIRENIPTYIKCLPRTSQNLLNAFSDLMALAELRLNTTAEVELHKEKMLHEICHESEKMERKIEEMRAQIREKEITMQWKIAEKQALIQKYKKALANKKWNNHILIRNEVSAANLQMSQICMKNEEKQQELKAEVAKVKLSYEKLLQENMNADKKLREKKARVLAQLKGWIKRYDNDIGERNREIDRLEDELDEKTAAYDEFMKSYEKQEADYNAIVAMREAEEKKLLEEKMLFFMMNRAARMIQQRWRTFRQKKKTKGKGKGKKGKK